MPNEKYSPLNFTCNTKSVPSAAEKVPVPVVFAAVVRWMDIFRILPQLQELIDRDLQTETTLLNLVKEQDDCESYIYIICSTYSTSCHGGQVLLGNSSLLDVCVVAPVSFMATYRKA